MLDELKEKREEKFQEIVTRGVELLINNQIKEGRIVLTNSYNKYFNYVSNIHWKSLMLRNLSTAERYLGNIELSKKYCKILYETILKDEANNIKDHPAEFIKSLNVYIEIFKENINKDELIKINQKIKKCAKDNNMLTDFYVAEINIYFLKSQYDSIIELLRKIHNKKIIEDNDERNIIDEVKYEFEILNKYNYIDKINEIENNLVAVNR